MQLPVIRNGRSNSADARQVLPVPAGPYRMMDRGPNMRVGEGEGEGEEGESVDVYTGVRNITNAGSDAIPPLQVEVEGMVERVQEVFKPFGSVQLELELGLGLGLDLWAGRCRGQRVCRHSSQYDLHT